MPSPPALPKPVKRAVFRESKKIRLGHIEFDYGLIEKSHEKAEAWINSHPGIDIVQIQTFHTPLSGITVIWHR